ncbi:MAG: YceI family protein [candidate division Zixibacteria bacterium]|nr:YceI family protein [candidate division Zixibacteria bacterium]MDH3936366.1 YceI family protein [candidate division Zixibacteria bacterium]MDH4032197.1 YceI family protein [candidate division Zixibacteria bacterium]
MTKHHACRRCFLVVTLVSMTALKLSSAEYHIERSPETIVSFVSESPLIDFEVNTDKIDGYAYWEGEGFPPDDSQLQSSEVYFEVQLNTFDAGNGMYNRHLKERYFETEKYPYASYKARITKVESMADSSFVVHTTGVFSLHGATKEIQVSGSAVSTDQGLTIHCEFAVKASDYDIEMPSLMMMEVDDDINVRLEFILKIAK